MNTNKINYKLVHIEDLTPDFLKKFNRFQETNLVLYVNEEVLEQKEDYFIDQWDDKKKGAVIESLKCCIAQNGKVIGAYEDGSLIGFANVDGELFGSEHQYAELPFIHVSNEKRGLGIGKQLFHRCCIEARKLGAEKLYIAAHPSIETQAFYKSAGCTTASEINPFILSKEPLDIQLEKRL